MSWWKPRVDVQLEKLDSAADLVRGEGHVHDIEEGEESPPEDGPSWTSRVADAVGTLAGGASASGDEAAGSGDNKEDEADSDDSWSDDEETRPKPVKSGGEQANGGGANVTRGSQGGERQKIEQGDETEYEMVYKTIVEQTKHFEYVLTFDRFKNPELRADVVKSMKAAGLTCKLYESADKNSVLVKVGAPMDRMEAEAERIELELPLKKDYPAFSEFSRENRDYYKETQFGSNPGELFPSLLRQRLIRSVISSPNDAGGAEVDLDELLRDEESGLESFTPLHQSLEKRYLEKNIIARESWKKPMPIDDLRNYFGEKVALYFAWLDFYRAWLLFPGLVGLVVFFWQIAQGFDKTKLPIGYAMFLSIWSSVYLAYWRRHQIQLAFNWNMLDFEETETVRPEFRGVEHESKYFPGHKELVMPQSEGMLRQIVSLPVLLTMMGMVVFAVASIYAFKAFAEQQVGAPYHGLVSGVLQAVTIGVMTGVYNKVALVLNEFENHRTETMYEDSLIAKSFSFQFINNYAALLYIAFFKNNITGLYNTQDPCDKNDCVGELFYLLITIYFGRMTYGQLMEIMMPVIKNKIGSFVEKKKKERMMKQGKTKELFVKPSFIEEECKMEAYVGTFDEYLEMCLQFGYVVLFAASFPIAAILAYLNNIVELRGDAAKLLTGLRRPEYQGAEDIGMWFSVQSATSYLGVIVNAAYVIFTSNQLFNEPDKFKEEGIEEYGGTLGEKWSAGSVWAFVLAEHFFIVLKFGVSILIPEMTEDVRQAIDAKSLGAGHLETKDERVRKRKIKEAFMRRKRDLRSEEKFEKPGSRYNIKRKARPAAAAENTEQEEL